jgi:hypothetical protein
MGLSWVGAGLAALCVATLGCARNAAMPHGRSPASFYLGHVGPPHVAARKIGVIYDPLVEYIEVLKLDFKIDYNDPRIGVISAQEFLQSHFLNHLAVGMLAINGYSDAELIAPLRSHVAFHMDRPFAVSDPDTGIFEGRSPDEISSWRLPGVSSLDVNQGLKLGDADAVKVTREWKENNFRLHNVDVRSDLRFTNLSLASFPESISGTPQQDRRYNQKAGEKTDEKPFIVVHIADNRRQKPFNATGDWMAFIIIGWFLVPVVAIIRRTNWLFVGWVYGTGLLLLATMLGLI